MGRMYSIVMDAQSISTAKDLISVTAAADKALVLHELNVTQESTETSDTGVVQIHRASGTAGVGASVVPRPLDAGDAAMSNGAFLTNLTTDETPGNILLRRAFNVLTGFHWLPTPESRIVVPGQGIVVVRSDIAISAATVTAELIVEELG